MKKSDTNKLLLFWYSHPRIAIGFILVGINLAVIFIFTVILSLISGNSFTDELSYLFTYTMCSDGIYDFVNEQEDLACFIVKIILTVLQMVIFSGALIGFATDILQNIFDKRLENTDKLYLKNHYVFLNWSTIGQNIIYDLSYLDGEKTVVILTEDDRETVINSIDNIFTLSGRKRKGLRIFVKKGNPNSSKHLADISISQAKHIGILSSDKPNISSSEVSTSDLESFKLLLSMIGQAPNANFVVETETEIAKDKIEKLVALVHPEIKDNISVFSHNAVMGYILGKTTINTMYSVLLHEVLSYDGVEFYGITATDIEDAMYTYNDCIPVVCYDDDKKTDTDGKTAADQLYVLSESSKTLGKRSQKKSFVQPLAYNESIQPENFTLFIFSCTNRVSFIISELDAYNNLYDSNIRYRIFSYDTDFDKALNEILATEGKKKILLLSNEDAELEEQDSAVFLLLLDLKAHPQIFESIEILVEIVNLDNLPAIENLEIASVILSNRIISLYMLQLMTHRKSRRFFRDLLITDNETGGIDFEIMRADSFLDFSNGNLAFSCYSELVQSFCIASGKTRMLIGYIKKDNQNKINYLCNKMDVVNELIIEPADELVLVVYR